MTVTTGPVYRTHIARNIGIVIVVLLLFFLLPIVPTTFTQGRLGFNQNTDARTSLSYATLGCGLVYVTGTSTTSPIGPTSQQSQNKLEFVCGNSVYSG